jgi:hypothetical protein
MYKLIIHEEVQMFTQPTTQVVQWQDIKVFSEVDLVLDIAQQNGWEDCEIFGHGDMITQPLESMGWKLIPADLYEYSIPTEGVDRILQVINMGVRIQGVIIADDQRKVNPPPTPAKPVISLPSAGTVLSMVCKALLGLIIIAGVALVGLTMIAGLIVLAPILILGAAMDHDPRLIDWDYDPKLIILVEDGNGETTWISVLTWFD